MLLGYLKAYLSSHEVHTSRILTNVMIMKDLKLVALPKCLKLDQVLYNDFWLGSKLDFGMEAQVVCIAIMPPHICAFEIKTGLEPGGLTIT